MHLFTSLCPQGTWNQRNHSTAGKVIFWTDKFRDVVSFFVEVVRVVEFFFISLALKILYLSMINDVNPTRRNLVIVTTYKLILATVLQSGKIGSDYAFDYLLVSTGNFKATK